ncbi:uncharacterized protein METZ01_LOCUS364571 [marine metagenome]|uniref:Uncharacterized protein n=1 Tax=marine metagenome TaxID=408172 RepID=A0A382SR81_9ZZZZ
MRPRTSVSSVSVQSHISSNFFPPAFRLSSVKDCLENEDLFIN